MGEGAAEAPAREPAVVAIDGAVTVREPDGVHRVVGRYERTGPWTLMAVTELEEHGPAAVFENLADPRGSILYVTAERVLLELTKTLVPTRVPEETCYGGHRKEDVLHGGQDVLRQELLSRTDDPTLDEVAALFPPIRRITCGPVECPHTFVGSRECADVVPVYYNPLRATPRVNPAVVAPEIRGAVECEELWEGLVGGWLPAVRVAYPCEGFTWDTITFAAVNTPNRHIQPVWYRFLRLEDGCVASARYVDSYLPYPWPTEPDPARFYRALYELHTYWSRAIAGAMQLELPEPWIADFCRHAMVQEMITRVGSHPKYGVLDRAYGSPEHDGLQDILTSAVSCYLEWGLFDVARRYLDNYFHEFVHNDGAVDYRGPEIGQYGRTLTLLAQYYEYTGDGSLLTRYDAKIRAIMRILCARREEAKQRNPADPAYGLLSGRHEADISFDTTTLATFDYERPYFCNSTEAWRGLRDLARAWRAVGRQRADPDLVNEAEQLRAEADALARDITHAIDRSWIERDGLRTLPLIAGSGRLHVDAPYRSCPESFDENRVWAEMLHSGIVPRSAVETILASAAARGDTTLGIFGNRKHVVAFTVYGEAYGMIHHDLIREFLLFYYAHMSHLHTRGTWTALECVDMDRDRCEHLPYCAPAQMTIPTITRWMLLFEDPLTDELWLAKGTPRCWLDSGQRIRVMSAPTRWGPTSFEIESRLDRGVVFATLDFPHTRAGVVKLRLRVPRLHMLAAVVVNGDEWHLFDADEETITLPAHVTSPVRITARYQREIEASGTSSMPEAQGGRALCAETDPPGARPSTRRGDSSVTPQPMK